MSNVEARGKKVASEVLGVPIEEVSTESRFVEDLNAESIQSIELVAAFEAEFDIEMSRASSLWPRSRPSSTSRWTRTRR